MCSFLLLDMPDNIAWSLSGVGAAFVSDVRLSDGAPGEETRVQWLSSGSPTTAQYVEIRGQWATAQPVRFIGIIGVAHVDSATQLDGLRFDVLGRRASDPSFTYPLGGNSTTATLKLHPDGTITGWVMTDEGLDDLVGVAVRLYNNKDGATVLTADSFVGIGQIAPFSAMPIRIKPGGWEEGTESQTRRTRTLGGQLHRRVWQGYRVVRFEVTPTDYQLVRGGGLDWQAAAARLRDGAPAGVVGSYQAPDDSFVELELNRTAVFGAAMPGGTSHVERYLFGSRWTLEEIPALPPP
jgi:hypothetical protein